MNNIIIGTAGHIDHGKSTLIKALTGISPDRLKEEKTRGITIDLGFAYIILPSGKRVGIVDVPGHEKFIKNMMTGATGIDVAILVIAADEGIMPQTTEHLNILELLEVKTGLIALTKSDLVEDEWLKMVIEDVRENIKGSFLENSPIIPTSTVTGQGLEELKIKLDEICSKDISRDTISPFRMPIDRVFSLQGIGTVITGSVASGKILIGDDVEIMPKRVKSKIRSIQVHNEEKDIAEAGNRTALNLTDVKTTDIQRGDVIAEVGSLIPVNSAYTYLRVIKDAPKKIRNRERVRIHVGTKEVMARVNILQKSEINPGDYGYVYISFEEPISAVYKDHYIVRSYSPVTTLGGGEILFPNPIKITKTKLDNAIKSLDSIYKGDEQDFIQGFLSYFGSPYVAVKSLCPLMGKSLTQVQEILEKLETARKIKTIKSSGKEYIISCDYLKYITQHNVRLLEDFHKKYPLSAGMSKEELKSQSSIREIFDELLKLWEKESFFEVYKDLIKLKGFKVTLTKEQKETYDKVIEIYQKGGWSPPDLTDVIEKVNKNDKEVLDIIYYLLDEGKLARLGPNLFMATDWINKARELLRDYFKKETKISVSEFRTMLNTTRKFALPLLEYFDDLKVTKRMQDVRIAGSAIKDKSIE